MPVYEYEPDDDRDCLICPGRIEVLQRVEEKPCKYCPLCGLGVKRVVSVASFTAREAVDADKAATRGFSTYRRAEKGLYEKTAGEGPDLISKDALDRSGLGDRI